MRRIDCRILASVVCLAMGSVVSAGVVFAQSDLDLGQGLNFSSQAVLRPGAGDLFHGGFVLYTKQHKVVFGIAKKLIDANGIVSEAVARVMAEGALKHSPADIAVGVTGVAGPEPDDEGNPVGLVCLAAARRGRKTMARTHHFKSKDRGEIRCRAAEEALKLVYRMARA